MYWFVVRPCIRTGSGGVLDSAQLRDKDADVVHHCIMSAVRDPINFHIRPASGRKKLGKVQLVTWHPLWSHLSAGACS